MSKIYKIIALTMLIANVAEAQTTNTFSTNRNTGIGTSTLDSNLNVLGEIHSSGMIGNTGAYFNVLKIKALDTSPAYFYVNTNIPATDIAAPQIQITGYMYGSVNKAMKVTLGWYYYQDNFYWTQYQSDLGYQRPQRIRLGKYQKNGIDYIRIEIANNSSYWSNYTISATDRDDLWAYYSDWTYGVGEMPDNTTKITEVAQQKEVAIDGKVGIGRLDPQYALDIRGEDYKQLRLSGGNTLIKFSNDAFNAGDGAELWQTNDGALAFNLTSALRAITFRNNGNVGIGTSAPESRLDVTSGLNNNQLSLAKNTLVGEEGPGIIFKNIVNNGLLTEIAGVQSKLLNGTTNFISGSLSMYTIHNSNKIEAITINPSGNIGFGTTTPDEKLSVNGKIHTKEIRVDMSGWPDYVFEKDYKINSLQETERFIKKNKHLPEMPSAQDIERNGIAVGDMLRLQQKKIEELTLHLIEKEKIMNKQQSLIEEQQKQLQNIERSLKLLMKKK